MGGTISDRDNTLGRVCAGARQNGKGRRTRKGRPVLDTAPGAAIGEEVGRWQILAPCSTLGLFRPLRQAQGERFSPGALSGTPTSWTTLTPLGQASLWVAPRGAGAMGLFRRFFAGGAVGDTHKLDDAYPVGAGKLVGGTPGMGDAPMGLFRRFLPRRGAGKGRQLRSLLILPR